MKINQLILSTLFVFSSFATQAQTLSAKEIVQNASSTFKELSTIKYFVKNYKIPQADTVQILKGTISLTRDATVDHSIFKGYKFKMDIEILIKERPTPITVQAAFDGTNLQVLKQGKLTMYENPDARTIMQKFGFELFSLVFNGFVSPNGVDFLLKRQLERLPDQVVNGVDSYVIEAKTSIPQSPGSTEMVESVTRWFFSTADYMITARKLAKQASSYTILDTNFTSTAMDHTLASQNVETEIVTNADVANENLIGLGESPPDWTAKNAFDETVGLTTYRGKILVIDFWGTWCAPCIKSIPSIQKLKDTFNEQIEVVGVAVNDKPQKAIDYMKKKGITYHLIPEGNEIAKAYDVAIYPTLYIIDQKGIVRYREKGFNANGFEDWSGVVQSLLGKD